MANRKIEVQIVGDASKLSRAFGQASSSGSKLGSSLAKVGKLAAVGLAGLGAGAAVAGKKMISMASDAAEVQSKMEVVFGKQLPALTKEIDKFSKATGTSRFEMREQAADMGALLAPLVGTKKGAADMSLQFVKLATDLGSFNNVPTEEALLAIRSGLVGEAEPLRRFGVLLNEAAVKSEALRLGLVKGKEELTEQQKVQARASLIMKQTTLAQDDATRTAGSFANQLKRLKSEVGDTATQIGMQLVPVASKVLGAMNEAAAGVGNFIAKFSQAQGFEAKVRVVLDTAGDLAQKAIKVGQDIGKQIADALGKVDWAATGNSIARGIGEAFRKGLPLLARFAQTITEGFTKALANADWVTIGAAIGQGIKDGMKKAAKQKVSEGLGDTLRDASSLGIRTAAIAGLQIGEALVEKFGSKTKEEMPSKMALVPLAIRKGVDPAIATAVAGGGRIGAGLAGGLTQALSGVGASVANTIIAQLNMTELQLKQKYGIHSPSTVWAKELGRPLGEGIVTGMDGGLALLAPTMVKKIQAAVARAKAVVDSARSRMQASFSLLSDKLLRAFDAETGGHKTAAELELDTIAARRQAEDLQRALDDAIAGGDSTAIARAQEDIRMAALERQAQAERQAYEDQRASMRDNLERRLQIMSAHFTKEGATVKKALAEIDKVMRAFGITFAESGQFIGKHFVAGLVRAIGGAAAGAAGVHGAQTGGPVRTSVPVQIVVQSVLDGEVLAESTQKHLLRKQARTGTLGFA